VFAAKVVASCPVQMSDKFSTLLVILANSVSSVASNAKKSPVFEAVSLMYFPPLSPNPLYSDAILNIG